MPLPAASTTAAIFCPASDKTFPPRSCPGLLGSRPPPAKWMPHVTVLRMFVDLHLHADGIPDQDLATLAYFGVKAAVTCARDAGAGSAADLRRHWDELVRVQTARLLQAGIRPMVALALHPSRIPWHGVDDLLQRLPHYFDDPRVVALGELGLHEGGEREEQILSRQLELAARLRKPVIVHTPDREKAARTRRLLALLKKSAVEPSRVLVDHVNAETFAVARGIGCWAGKGRRYRNPAGPLGDRRRKPGTRLEEAYLLALVSALIAATHPSLFFDSSDVPALRQSAQTTHAAIASHITAILNQHLNDPAPTAGDYDDYRFLGNQVAVWAFGYQLTGNAQSAAMAQKQRLTYAGWSSWDNGEIADLGGPDLNTAHMLLGNSVAYDWVYETLSAADRTTIANKIGAEAQKVADYMPNAWWVDEYLQNHNWIDTAGLGMAALALQ